MQSHVDAQKFTMNEVLDVPAIPAMTSEAERRCFYKWSLDCSPWGDVVELGAWLGAGTAFLAAGVRDSHSQRKLHTYDRFVWQPDHHERKAGKVLERDMLEEFKDNLGPLLQYVEPHRGEIRDVRWDGGFVPLIVFDAPKRTREISAALTAFASAVGPGTILIWQDFAHSASYEIAAAMSRLGSRVEFLEAVPGSTVVFRVLTSWKKDEVSADALDVESWTADEIEETWNDWLEVLPLDMRAHFEAGAAMFLCDRGDVQRARMKFRKVVEDHGEIVLPKWRDMYQYRPPLRKRYAALISEIVDRL